MGEHMAAISLSLCGAQIACIDLVLHVIQTAIIAVGNNGLTAILELLKIIDDFTTEEGATILQHQLIEDDR